MTAAPAKHFWRAAVAAALVATALMATGCGKKRITLDEGKPGASPEGLGEALPYAPLAVGMAWTYRGSMSGGDARTVRIVDKTGNYFVDSEGGKFIADAYSLRDAHRELLKGPIAAGTRWKSIPDPAQVENFEIKAVGVPVQVPAGQFDATVEVLGKRAAGKGVTQVMSWTYAKGVGLIKMEAWVEHPTKGRVDQGMMELVKFEQPPVTAPPAKP